MTVTEIISPIRREVARNTDILAAADNLRAVVHPGLLAADVTEVADPAVRAALVALIAAALAGGR